MGGEVEDGGDLGELHERADDEEDARCASKVD